VGGVLHVGAADAVAEDVVLVFELVATEDVVVAINLVVVENAVLDVELVEIVDDFEVELAFVVTLTG